MSEETEAADRSHWTTPTSKPPSAWELGSGGIDGDFARLDNRQWAALISLWGTADVAVIGPFDVWDEAAAWGENAAVLHHCVMYGVLEYRRPKGDWMMQPPRRRGPRRADGRTV